MGTEDINQHYDDNNNVEEIGEPDAFQNYEWEKKVHKNSLKKKLSQAKRLLVNRASNEYSQVDEQHETKTISQMLVSVSKINDLKGILSSFTFLITNRVVCKLTSSSYSYENKKILSSLDNLTRIVE